MFIDIRMINKCWHIYTVKYYTKIIHWCTHNNMMNLIAAMLNQRSQTQKSSYSMVIFTQSSRTSKTNLQPQNSEEELPLRRVFTKMGH